MTMMLIMIIIIILIYSRLFFTVVARWKNNIKGDFRKI